MRSRWCSDSTPSALTVTVCGLTVRATLAAALLIGINGCGASGGGSAEDAESVAVLVSEVADGSRNPQSFERLFARGATPADAERKKYGKFYFHSPDPPIFSGDQATVRVVVADIATDQSQGEVTWTALKVDGKWKLKSAPLP